ncbi:MAG: bifunctional tRNA 2-selenouridine(34) synthase MnmH/selenide, water dikinase SelD, partial [Fimbriimonadaceae bacterium]|nr:bifunctional tRNA 2-selenouridine(34) synthase MnmH/selenide, water dikinase SelD [Chitinophagales bacterium]
PEKRIWLEDESHLIGNVFIPEEFWQQMRNAPVVYCDFPVEERINYLVNTYGDFNKEGVINAVKKITKRLGGQHAKDAIENYESGNLHEATKIVLVYYDKTYQYGLDQRSTEKIFKIEMEKIDPEENAIEIIQKVSCIKYQESSIVV